MLEVTAPSPLNGDMLRADLSAAGIATDALLVGDMLTLPDIDESHRAQVEPILAGHASKAQAELDKAAAERANETTIRTQADQALATNATFLGIASPTNAQVAAQVKALTRQSNGLIRLALRRFDATT